jgi:hypothetical protein
VKKEKNEERKRKLGEKGRGRRKRSFENIGGKEWPRNREVKTESGEREKEGGETEKMSR